MTRLPPNWTHTVTHTSDVGETRRLVVPLSRREVLQLPREPRYPDDYSNHWQDPPAKATYQLPYQLMQAVERRAREAGLSVEDFALANLDRVEEVEAFVKNHCWMRPASFAAELLRKAETRYPPPPPGAPRPTVKELMAPTSPPSALGHSWRFWLGEVTTRSLAEVKAFIAEEAKRTGDSPELIALRTLSDRYEIANFALHMVNISPDSAGTAVRIALAADRVHPDGRTHWDGAVDWLRMVKPRSWQQLKADLQCDADAQGVAFEDFGLQTLSEIREMDLFLHEVYGNAPRSGCQTLTKLIESGFIPEKHALLWIASAQRVLTPKLDENYASRGRIAESLLRT